MVNYYDFRFIPYLLKIFKVKNVILAGLNDENLLNEILNYDANYAAINFKKINNIETIVDSPLNAINNFNNYDAIFIDDDSNWFTIFNELNMIKNTNESFPLVFICNNRFPNKRRDSYSNPDMIPIEFRQKFTNKFPICYNNEEIMISDGFYHACNENTPKNGVLTAIEDFLSENAHIGMLNINFIEDIVILYLKIPINQKRIEIISRDIQENNVVDINISDKINENKLLINYINRYDIENDDLTELEVEILKKNTIIGNYEKKIRNNTNELIYKNSHINNIESKLSLKDSEIEIAESKLINRENRIKSLENQITVLNHKIGKEKKHLKNKKITYNNQITISNNQINSLKKELLEKERSYTNLEHELKGQISNLDSNIDQKNVEISNLKGQISNLDSSIDQKNVEISNLKGQISNLDSSIDQKNVEITNLKNRIITVDDEKEVLNKELSKKENIVLKKDSELEIHNGQIKEMDIYIRQKDNQLKLKQSELNTKEKKINFLERQYLNKLSEIDTKKYSINCLKDEISNNHLEINYFKNNSIMKKILSPIGYLYLIIKSKPHEISINIKLYKLLKDSSCFNIGFYLNNNKDLLGSKWCKYFSPELHYVCNGFEENRTFNKKYFNRNSKKDLLNYLLNCDE